MSVFSGPMIEDCVYRTRRMRESRMETGAEWPPTGLLPGPIIDIDPFDPDSVGPNSYDLRLSPELRCYQQVQVGADGNVRYVLDMRQENSTFQITIPEEGYTLIPGMFYLGSTVERTACAGVVPWIDGRSSVGRLGIQIHATAGRGDDGFGMDVPGGCPWTLEITVHRAVRVYPLVRVAQITFMRLEGQRKPYKGKYARQSGPTPSQMWMDPLPPSKSFDDGGAGGGE